MERSMEVEMWWEKRRRGGERVEGRGGKREGMGDRDADASRWKR